MICDLPSIAIDADNYALLKSLVPSFPLQDSINAQGTKVQQLKLMSTFVDEYVPA